MHIVLILRLKVKIDTRTNSCHYPLSMSGCECECLNVCFRFVCLTSCASRKGISKQRFLRSLCNSVSVLLQYVNRGRTSVLCPSNWERSGCFKAELWGGGKLRELLFFSFSFQRTSKTKGIILSFVFIFDNIHPQILHFLWEDFIYSTILCMKDWIKTRSLYKFCLFSRQEDHLSMTSSLICVMADVFLNSWRVWLAMK